jgi:hypothetical protein
MNESLNRMASEYVGIIAFAGVVGLTLTIVFGGLAVYFYYNPKRQKYKLRYKIFAHGFTSALVYLKGLTASSSSDEYVFDSYIDIWNAGQDSIGPDVVRGPVQVYLDPSLTETEILSVEMSDSIASEVANVRVTSVDGKVKIEWDHLDPGESIRLRVVTNRPLRNKDFGLLGKGLRLSIGTSATDEGGWLRELLTPLLVGAAVIAAGSLCAQLTLMAFERIDRDSVWTWVLAFPVLVLGFLGVVGLPMASGVLMANALQTLMNNKSPIERSAGVPSVGVPAVVSKKLYLEFLASLEPEELEALIRRHQMETADRDMGLRRVSGIFVTEATQPPADADPPS